MTWFDEISDMKTARERAHTAFYAPIGMMSPLWIAFGAAASAGAAFWLMTRLAKPVNIEAMMARTSDASSADPARTETLTLSPVEETVIEAVVEKVHPTVSDADDLTQLVGVGPKIANALAERGVKSFAQLAAWTDQDLEAFDAALDLRGRAIRAGFIAQARGLVAGQA